MSVGYSMFIDDAVVVYPVGEGGGIGFGNEEEGRCIQTGGRIKDKGDQ